MVLKYDDFGTPYREPSTCCRAIASRARAEAAKSAFLITPTYTLKVSPETCDWQIRQIFKARSCGKLRRPVLTQMTAIHRVEPTSRFVH